jgi:PKD repeat protein
MRVFFTILLYSLCLNVFSQKESFVWYFNGNAGLNFSTMPPTILADGGLLQGYEGNGCISDKDGKIKYYTDGKVVYNAQHNSVYNGTGLMGDYSSTQGSLIINHPKKRQDYYIFTSVGGIEYGPFYVNLLRNDSIRFKNKLFLKYGSEKLNAVNHQNNNDIWVATYNPNTNTYYFYLITKYGIIDCPDSFRVTKFKTDYRNAVGQLKFSPDGMYLASNAGNVFYTTFCKFDNENGTIKKYFNIPSFPPYSSEYSSNGKYLYVLDRKSELSQYDISSFDSIKIAASRIKINTFPRGTIYGMQIGPDRKIYIARPGEHFLSIINNPDSAGLKCGYKDTGLSLGNRISAVGFPNFNQSYFYTPSVDYAYAQDCRTNIIAFEGRDTFKATSYQWIFSKGTKTDIKAGKDANYTFADTGKWEVKYIASNGIRSDTVSKIITIRPILEQGFLGGDISYCQTLPTLYTPKNLHCIHWYNDTMMELGKADTFIVPKAGIYYAKATNQSYCVEWDTIIISKATPKADFATKNVCESDSAVFVNASENANSFVWKFGDGKTNNLKNPTHKYQITSSTTYNVTLIAKTDGCSDSTIKTVTVNKNPSSGFSYTQTGNIFDLKADIEGLANYKWTFGKTDSITKTIPTHTHTATKGQEKICLIVTDLAGCQSQTCTTAVLGIKPIFKENDISIYPNPSKGKIIININKSGIYSAKVYNETGQLVFEKSIQGYQQYTLTISQPAGNYLLEIIDSEGRRMKRIVVIE